MGAVPRSAWHPSNLPAEWLHLVICNKLGYAEECSSAVLIPQPFFEGAGRMDVTGWGRRAGPREELQGSWLHPVGLSLGALLWALGPP